MRVAELEDLLRIRGLAVQHALALSPDGDVLAYPVHEERDRRHPGHLPPGAVPPSAVGVRLQLAELGHDRAAALEGIPRELTSWGPSWSWDGQTLAFFGAAEERGPVHLHVWGRQERRGRCACTAPVWTQGFPHDRPAWTADGRLCVVLLSPAGGERSGPAEAPIGGPSVLVFESPGTQGAEGPSLSGDAHGDLVLIDPHTGAVERLLEGVPALRGHPAPPAASSPLHGWILWEERVRQPESTRFRFRRGLHLLAVAERRDLLLRVWDDEGAVHHPPRWAPDGRRFAVVSDGRPLVWEAADPEAPPRLGALPDGRRAQGGFLAWTADGSGLLLWGDRELWFVPSDGGGSAAVRLSVPGREVVGLLHDAAHGWLPPGGVWVVTRDPATERGGLFRLPLDGGAAECLVEEPHRFWAAPRSPLLTVAGDATPSGTRFVYTVQEAERPGQVLRVTGDGRRWVGIDLNAEVRDVRFGRRRTFRYRTVDGQEVGARLLLPPDWQEGVPCPTLVAVYPGTAPSRNPQEFDGGDIVPHQLLAARGYAVLEPDVPYSPAEARDPADAAAAAVLPAVNEAVRLGYADPDRLALAGHSYGGYAVLTVLCRTGRFRAAVASAAAADLVSAYGAMPGAPAARDRAFGVFWCENGQAGMGAPPWVRPLRYVANSPVFSLDRITTPLLLIAGAEDETVPWWQAAEAFVGLRRLGRPCTLLLYRGETHVPSRWSVANRRDLADRVLEWLDRHLRGREGKGRDP
jgi:acetyl esterase/lipase